MKTSIFKWIPILSLFVPSWARITYDEANYQIFNDKAEMPIEKIYDSMQATQNFFAKKEVSTAVLTGLMLTTYIPYLNQIAGILFVMRALLAAESDWKRQFAKSISNEIGRQILSNDIRWMQSSVQMIEENYMLLNSSDERTRQTTAVKIHSELNKILNHFAVSDSLYKVYPLIATPPLNVLAQLIAYFEPILTTIYPEVAETPELTCKVHNILLDYRPRTVNARLEKLRLETLLVSGFLELSETLNNARLIKYNLNGYNKTITGTLDCEKGCKIPEGPSFFYPNTKFTRCLKDALGADEFDIPYGLPHTCITDYALLVRHRVEEFFDVRLFNTLCGKPQQKTGFGWLTIKLRDGAAYDLENGKNCDFLMLTHCDPFVILTIDGKPKVETPVKTNTYWYDLDLTYVSLKISKDALIKLEVWDADHGSDKQLILRKEGNVDSFLKDGHMGWYQASRNFLRTISFWQDEYEEIDIQRDKSSKYY